MNFLDRRYFLIIITLGYFGLGLTQPIIADDFDDSGDVFFDSVWDDFDDNAKPDITRSLTSVATLEFCTQIIKLNNVVKNNIYLKTNPINDRSLTSMPVFLLYHSDNLNTCSLFNAYIFYNETAKQFFTGSNPNINSYILLNTQNVINDLSSNVTTLEVPPVLELFRNGQVQERRLGIMFQFLKNFENWSLEGMIPLNYQERNIFFSDSDQAIIQRELSKITGTTSSSANESFLRKHVVSDRIGLGNLKLRAGYNVLNHDTLKFKGGLVLNLPTSFSFVKGLIGSDFRKNITTPNLDLNTVCEWALEIQDGDNTHLNDLKDYLTNFGVQFLDRFGAIVLDQSLGNYHHLEVGLFYDAKIIVDINTSLLIEGELLYSVPHKEMRFFTQRKDSSDFTDDALSVPPPGPNQEAEAQLKVDFLSANAISSLFPNETKMHVSPQLTYQINVGPKFELGAYAFYLGYNFWCSTEERLGKYEMFAPYPIYPLNLEDGARCYATQHKLCMHFDYQYVTPQHLWAFSIRADDTLFSTGIGQDFNFALELSVDF